MMDEDAAYAALKSHDSRFDGVFFVGVTSTGIYCRPVCPARTPRRGNCRFFKGAEAAEKAGFRPCLRCRPELAPGNAAIDRAQRIAQALSRRIDEGFVDDGARLEEMAAQFDLSSRQLRRIIRQELGVSPIELMQTRRVLLAKQLLTETALPVIDVAFASGFSSLRRFNDAFRARYRMPPTQLRKQAAVPAATGAGDGTSTLRLAYRPPYEWKAMLEFLRGRMIRDVEHVTEDCYMRTVQLGRHSGWLRVTHAPEKHALIVEFANALSPVLPALLGRLRNLFDLSARPDLIAEHLSRDVRLRGSVSTHPGLRVPGAFDEFEMAVRAILGQQITVKAATTISGRFACAFGEPIMTPFPELRRLGPSAGRVASASVADIAKLGIVSARAASLVALAGVFGVGELSFEGEPDEVIRRLHAIPGIGPWTAHYIAMRTSRWPDAFPKEDIAVRKKLGGVGAKRAEEISQAWRPWRSYAVMHLWRSS